MQFLNGSGNNIFYDQQYQVMGNTSRIADEALWGNPLDLSADIVSFDFCDVDPGDCTGVSSVSFDLAWSEAGQPTSSDEVAFYAQDSEGRSSFFSLQFDDPFVGLGGNVGLEMGLSQSPMSTGNFNTN